MRVEYVFVLLLLAMAIGADAGDQGSLSQKVEEELRYAEALRKRGLYEFADVVTARIPENKATSVVLAKFATFVHRNLEDDKKIASYIRKQAGDDIELYWAMRIQRADAYWSRGKHGECLKIYEEFMRFYQELLERADDVRPAVQT